MKRYLVGLCCLLILLTACGDGGDKETSKPIAATPIALNNTPVPATVQTAIINAGDIDDNAQWNTYSQYRDYFLQSGYLVHDVDVSQRQRITVIDAQERPILGARVAIYSGDTLITESRTYATGQTLFFPSAWTTAQNQQAYRVIVQKEETAAEFTLDPQAAADWTVILQINQERDTVPLDVLFLLDATASMSDEIRQLQDNILTISSQINALPGHIDAHYGLVTYRDRGDDYITRSYGFVRDVQAFQQELDAVQAEGGGDMPESLNEALHQTIEEMDWRGDNNIKLVFLVADAAPHLDYVGDYDYAQEMVTAAWKGIKIHPIASSGLEADGEFIFRQIAQYTMGHFIFLTYAEDGSGEPGTERPDLAAGAQANYTVEQLDDLVLKLITDEIAALATPFAGNSTQAQAQTIEPLPEPDLPAHFALVGVPQQIAAPQQTASTAPPTKAGETKLSLRSVLVIAVICLGIGYLVSARQRMQKRKRKIEDLLYHAHDYQEPEN